MTGADALARAGASASAIARPIGSPSRQRRRPRRARYLVASLAVVLGVLVAVLATRSTPPGTDAYSSLGGKIAPPVSGRAIVGGEQVSLASLRGKYVLLDFFASWCAVCEVEVPQIEAFLFTHRASHDVAVLGVDGADSASDGAAFLKRTGATWPAIEDSSGDIELAYGVTGPPASFLIAPDGRVIAKIVGGATAATLDRLVADAQATSP